jgi:hypothetical protein
MYKNVLRLFIFIIISVAFFHKPAFAGDYIPKKRVVVLVYDDSGSMWVKDDDKGRSLPIDNWKYANYSLQSFIGLLDLGDQLFIVPMSNPNHTHEVQISSYDRQNEIYEINQFAGKKGTPFQSVITATEQMKRSIAEDKHAEFWFIVLTDGVFNELDKNDYEDFSKYKKVKEDAFKQLSDFKNFVENENVLFKSALVTIESYLTLEELEQMEAFKTMWRDSIGGEFIQGESGSDILERIHEVAALISNRDPHNKHGFQLPYEFSRNTLTVYSPFPLRRITLLEQAVNEFNYVKVKDVTINDLQSEHYIDGPYMIESLEDPNELSENIFGTITHIKHQGKYNVLPAGDYAITFTQQLSKETIKQIEILAEPAVDFEVSYLKVLEDGSTSDNEEEYFVGSKMKLQVTLLKSGSKKEELHLSEMGNINDFIEVNAVINDERIVLSWDEVEKKFVGLFPLPEQDLVHMTTSVNIKGFYFEEKQNKLSILPKRKLTIIPLTSNWVSKVNQLQNAEPILFQPLLNGEVLSEEEIAEMMEHVKIKLGDYKINFTIFQDGNRIAVLPKPYKHEGFTSYGNIPFKIEIEGKYEGEKAEAQYALNIKPLTKMEMLAQYKNYLIGSVIALILGLWVYGVLTKDKFDLKDCIEVVRINKSNPYDKSLDTYFLKEKASTFKRWVYPFKPEHCTVGSLTFIATVNGILLSRGSILPNGEMKIEGLPVEVFEDEERDEFISPNETIEFEDPHYKNKFQYKKEYFEEDFIDG